MKITRQYARNLNLLNMLVVFVMALGDLVRLWDIPAWFIDRWIIAYWLIYILAGLLPDTVKSTKIEYAENGTIIGYKVLAVEYTAYRHRIRLMSPIYAFWWSKGWNAASENHTGFGGFGSGFYAFDSQEPAFQELKVHNFYVGVKLELAGNVAVHETGYRAECARIVGIMPIGQFYSLVADEYKVPVLGDAK